MNDLFETDFHSVNIEFYGLYSNVVRMRQRLYMLMWMHFFEILWSLMLHRATSRHFSILLLVLLFHVNPWSSKWIQSFRRHDYFIFKKHFTRVPTVVAANNVYHVLSNGTSLCFRTFLLLTSKKMNGKYHMSGFNRWEPMVTPWKFQWSFRRAYHSRNSYIACSARSPDFSSCDFFLWWNLKSKMYHDKSRMISQLNEKF